MEGGKDKMDEHYVPNPHKKPKHHWKFYLFLIFMGVLLFLIYSSYYPTSFAGKITGNIIKNSESFTEESQIKAELKTQEELKIDSKITKINLIIKSPTNFYIGKQKIEIQEPNTASIVIDNFEGQVIIYPENKIKLKGKSTQIFFDGLPISLDSGSEIDIELNEDTIYSYLKLLDFYLPSFSLETSGEISIDNGKIQIRSDNEKIKLPDFKGNLETKEGIIKINGVIEKSDVKELLGSINL